MQSQDDATVTAPSNDDRQTSHSRYLWQWLLVASVLMGAVVAFNVSVDPYFRFANARVDGWNARKPKAIRQVRMTKAYGVARGSYKLLLLGNSRVDIGIDPSSSEIPSRLRPAYNLGQPGGGTELASQYLQHALVTQTPDAVLLGVDFLNFLRKPDHLVGATSDDAENETSSAADSRLLARRGGPTPFAALKSRASDIVASTVSLTALKDSMITVAEQRSPYTADMSDEGFNSGVAFRQLIRDEGQAALFRQKNLEYAQKCLTRVAPAMDRSTEFLAVEAVLQACQSEDIHIDVFIHPYHVDILEIFDESGRWDDFERWKASLTHLCDRYDVSLWDFSSYNNYTTEPTPTPKDKKTIMRWYWESGHYRSELGDRILSKIYRDSSIAEEPVGDRPLARRLTPEVLDDWLESERRAQQAYAQLFAASSESTRGLVQNLTAKDNASP
ncbi:hypothetical protein [Rubripirellula reticaptiva]|uniref:Uncharacterized protein n=1 Tax=Rubripirellula reticaptiva TaxID=2528013 RepID=A0A5C6F840_9BACT|nr:hypothetical protein [Rubripirellula reticaptiva]TWU55681.1 hypothetical protein Poly59_19810 [Rubripirellula reticaptiva]